MYNFEFDKPGTVADAVAALGQEDAQALGGGQTLIPTLRTARPISVTLRGAIAAPLAARLPTMTPLPAILLRPLARVPPS